MIVRILGEGQYRIPETAVATIQAVDEKLEAAVAAADEQAFGASLEALVQAIRDHGTMLADDELVPSDAVVPDADTTLEEARALLSDEGLIPD